jgi:hypothetical protein
MFLINWLKKNKLTTVLLLVILGLYIRTSPPVLNTAQMEYSSAPGIGAVSKGVSSRAGLDIAIPSIFQNPAPQLDVKDRMVIQNSYLSLLVKDVPQSVSSIRQKTTELGGYMVESDITRPEEGGTGTITVRIPEERLDQALKFFKSLAVKVVSENLKGEDVTDQYVDNDARLAILTTNKNRFEEIMAKAEKIDDILRVQQEIFNLQSQIESIKGQQNYLANSAKSVKITIYLSTDELSLPYAPAQPWRPEVVFKLAVRSVLGTLQQLGTLVIWLAVYAVIWVPVGVIFLILRRKYLKS